MQDLNEHKILTEAYRDLVAEEDRDNEVIAKGLYLDSKRVKTIYDESSEENVKAVVYGKWDDGATGYIEFNRDPSRSKYYLMIFNQEWESDDLSELEEHLWKYIGTDLNPEELIPE